MKKLQTEFIDALYKVSEEKYWEMLECLPPERMAYGGFLVGEPVKYNIVGEALYELYIIKNNTYFYAGLATTKDFDLFTIGCLPVHPIHAGETKVE